MSQRLVFGLDLGINNVGWAAIQVSEGDSQKAVNILAMGTFVFDSPLSDENNPQDGLKTKVRGLKRRGRRTSHRRHQRKMRLYRLLAEHGLLPRQLSDREELLCAKTEPYSLRTKGLSEKLDPYEFGRVLCHLNQRRGFLSPRDLLLFGIAKVDDDPDLEQSPEDSNGEDTGRIKEEARRTREAMEGFETIGAFLHSRLFIERLPIRKKSIKKGNKMVQDETRFVRPDRHMIQEEFDLLWKRQAKHHPILTTQLKAQIASILFDQRKLTIRRSSRGKCVFYPKELRMPRAGLTAQKFIVAQKVAQVGVLTSDGSGERRLRPEERSLLVDALMRGKDLNLIEAKAMLGLLPSEILKGEPPKETRKAKASKEKRPEGSLPGSQTVRQIKQIIGEKWNLLDAQAQRDLVGEIVSIRDWYEDRDSDARPAALRRRDLFRTKSYGPSKVTLTEREANELATVALPAGYLNLSLKAAKRILPYLLSGNNYSESCTMAGLDHANPEGELPTLDRLPFPSEDQIPHAVVRTSVRSAVRVLNTLHAEFGKPDAIHIELPRDLAIGAKARLKEEEKIRKKEVVRKGIVEELVKIRQKPTRANIRKVELWRELGVGGLLMEPHEIVHDIYALFRDGYDVCHIVPRGHSLDNSMNNLFLGTQKFNRQYQRNRIPYEAFRQNGDQATWEGRIVPHVKSVKSLSDYKRCKILAKELPEDFTGRHLAATGWLSREVLKLAQQMLRHKTDAVVVPGRATSEFRKFWGLENLVPLHPKEQAELEAWKKFLVLAENGKASEDDIKSAKAPGSKARSNFAHHALDALVVALTSRASLQALASYEQLRDTWDERLTDKARRKEERARAMPDPELRSKAEAALRRAEIVHRPTRRPSGRLHEETAHRVEPQSAFGKPRTSALDQKRLVRFDQQGRPAQSYDLKANHHCVIWERTTPDAKGIYARCAEVVPTIEAVRRRNCREPVVRKSHSQPGWRYVMSLVQGDVVEMADGRVAQVRSFSPTQNSVDMELWEPFAASKLGHKKADNPYFIMRVRNNTALSELGTRIICNPLGRVTYREGSRE